MNFKTFTESVQKLTSQYTGRFEVNPGPRVGSYESAVRRQRSRGRAYWVISERLPFIVRKRWQEPGSTSWWESRTSSVPREDIGKFKTKAQAIMFLQQQAKLTGGKLEGDPTGYPELVLPGAKKTDVFKIVDLKPGQTIDEL